MTRLLTAAVLLALAAGTAHAQGVSAADAWARATASSAQSGAIYLSLTGKGTADRLTGASTPVATRAELHETVNEGGVMRMRELAAGLALPPGQTVTLRPGGLHIMLMGMKQGLKPGEHFPVTLTFAAAPPVTVDVTVGTAGATAAPTGHTH